MRNYGIDNLRFFDTEGREILMKKQYSASWEIFPADQTFSAFMKNPSGHLEMYPDNNIEFATSIGNPTPKTDYVQIIADRTYIITLSGDRSEVIQHISLYNSRKSQITNPANILNRPEVKSTTNTTSDDAGVTVTTIEFSGSFMASNGVSYFTVTSDTADLYRQVSERSTSLSIIVDEPGQLRNKTAFLKKDYDINELYDYKSNTFKAVTLSTLGDVELNSVFDILFFSFRYKDSSAKEYIECFNKIVITLFNGEETATAEYNLIDLFRTDAAHAKDGNLIKIKSYDAIEDFNTAITATTQSSTSNDIFGVTSDVFTQVQIKDSSFDDLKEELDIYEQQQTTAYYIMSYNIGRDQFPYVKYVGSYTLESVSTDFISVATIVVVSETTDDTTGKITYSYPDIHDTEADESFRLHFHFRPDSEMNFIGYNDKFEVTRRKDSFTMTADENEIANRNRTDDNIWKIGHNSAMNFTVGFESDTEGYYENVMGIFIRNNETDEDFLVGAIRFNTEAIGEDERFRTLLGNFGIPDPVKYPNIFKSQSVDENGTDWKLINEKSKELFLYYDEIFPYAGTYKALFNAIKFLGYQDLVFKEWYNIKDLNENNRYIAVQTYDTNTGNPITGVLKNYGIDYEQYERYRKLNRLSMTYHLQEMSSNDEEHIYADNNTKDYYKYLDVPGVNNIYEYRSTEVLAKLYSVKKWLERHIIGVNCYISDINGEGIILERLKTVGYVTSHEFKDIQNRGCFTPNAVTVTDFCDSSTIIQCSLNEFDAVTFEDYADFPIEQFIKYGHSKTVTVGGKQVEVYESAPLGAMTIADEYEFILNLNNAESGSLYEFSANDSSVNPIIVNDGEIKFWDDKYTTSNIDKNELPVIYIKKGNIRMTSGEWNVSADEHNILWSIQTVVDMKTVESEDDPTVEEYIPTESFAVAKQMRTTKEKEVAIRAKSGIMLSPDYDKNPSFRYTSDNKWGVPLFIFKDYTITNQYQSDLYDTESKYNTPVSVFDESTASECVIEIIIGEMRFRNHIPSDIKKQCNGAVITFEEPNREDYGEQVININYSYKSDRVPTYTFNKNSISNSYNSMKGLFDAVETNTHFNTKVDVPVNRLGDYIVSVNAYDAWNNVFTNKSDDICSVTTQRMSIDMIVNQDYSNNMSDFFRDNKQIDPSTNEAFDTDSETFTTLKNKMSKLPKFPIAYKIYDASHINDDNTISYNNISYAIDTPKANDYIIVSNLTERAKKISLSGRTLLIELDENNPNKQNLHIDIAQKQKVMLCVYDDNTQEILAALDEPFAVNVFVNNQKTFITGTPPEPEFYNFLAENITIINDHKYNINLYVINATQVSIDTSVCDIANYTETLDGSVFRYAFVPTDIIDTSKTESYVFNPDTVVKVCAVSYDGSDEMFNNQTAYRVLDTSVNTITVNDTEKKAVGYILDGNIDLNKIKSRRNLNKFTKASTPIG